MELLGSDLPINEYAYHQRIYRSYRCSLGGGKVSRVNAAHDDYGAEQGDDGGAGGGKEFPHRGELSGGGALGLGKEEDQYHHGHAHDNAGNYAAHKQRANGNSALHRVEYHRYAGRDYGAYYGRGAGHGG